MLYCKFKTQSTYQSYSKTPNIRFYPETSTAFWRVDSFWLTSKWKTAINLNTTTKHCKISKPLTIISGLNYWNNVDTATYWHVELAPYSCHSQRVFQITTHSIITDFNFTRSIYQYIRRLNISVYYTQLSFQKFQGSNNLKILTKLPSVNIKNCYSSEITTAWNTTFLKTKLRTANMKLPLKIIYKKALRNIGFATLSSSRNIAIVHFYIKLLPWFLCLDQTIHTFLQLFKQK